MSWDPTLEASLERAKQAVLREFGDDPNVNGAGIGVREREGALTDEPVVVVFVVKKRPEGLVPRGRVLPAAVEADGRSWGVDVVESGRVRASHPQALARRYATTLEPIIDRVRPPEQGCSVGVWAHHSTGTYGATVRDLTDGTICLLSCNHVLAGNNQGSPGVDIVTQPGPADGGYESGDRIGVLKRFHPINPAGTTTDAAIAQLDDQSSYTDAALGMMGPITPGHPAVGMVVAGGNDESYLAPIDTTLAAVNAEMLNATAGSSATTAAVPGMAIEKVGRTTWYTSSQVRAINVEVPVHVDGIGQVTYTGMIASSRLACPGDSGAVACAGGDGQQQAPRCECTVFETGGAYYDIPLASDEALADQFRDEILAQSPAGYLIITAVYGNPELVERLNQRAPTSWEQDYAQQYYDKYHDLVAGMLADPDSPVVITQEHLDDAGQIIYSMAYGGPSGVFEPVMTPDEGYAVANLYVDVLYPMLGMNRQQVVTYMNQQSVHDLVRTWLETVPTFDLNRPYIGE